jgi:hypothetical protein
MIEMPMLCLLEKFSIRYDGFELVVRQIRGLALPGRDLHKGHVP